MTIEEINNAKKLFDELEFIDNLIKSLHANAQKLANENAKIVMSIKIKYPESKGAKVLDEDGSLASDSFEAMARRMMMPWATPSDYAKEAKKEKFHTEINISELYAMEIFTQVLNNAMKEREKIVKKIEQLKSK
jgi:hypothetical protein